MCKAARSLREGFPTWTPDWSRHGYIGVLPLGLHHREPRFAAAGDSVAQYEFLKDGYVLQAAGYEIGTIAAVGIPYKKSKSAAMSVKPALHIFHDWWNLFATSVPQP
jgi:hypothetical protein